MIDFNAKMTSLHYEQESCFHHYLFNLKCEIHFGQQAFLGLLFLVYMKQEHEQVHTRSCKIYLKKVIGFEHMLRKV